MNRADLQALALVRLDEARSLLEEGHPSGAFYLGGYAVECALKAAIAKGTQQYDFPDRKRALDSYTHDLLQLIRVANLNDQLQSEIDRGSTIAANWKTVKDWSEASRYLIYDEEAAKSLLYAISDIENGVFGWITQYW